MKKTAIILGAVLFLFTATVNAQTETAKTTTSSSDKWNNWSPDKYKMLPMPEALTTEQIFPVIGTYTVTSTNATTTASTTDATMSTTTSSNVTITLDENNKGVVWVEGLPQGKFKAYLKKSPTTYMIPAQKVDEKEVPAGVLIYNKEANTLDVCIGCKYNNDDPASAFTVAEPVVEEPAVTTKTKNKKTAKAKVIPVKTWKYTGSKTETSVPVPAQQ